VYTCQLRHPIITPFNHHTSTRTSSPASITAFPLCLPFSLSQSPQSRTGFEVSHLIEETTNIPLFTNEGPAVHKDLCFVSRFLHIGAGETIPIKGAPFLLLLSGQATIYTDDHAGLVEKLTPNRPVSRSVSDGHAGVPPGGVTEDELKSLFDSIDVDGSGAIDADELQTALELMGVRITHEAVLELMAGVDEDGSGELEFPEFVDILTTKLKLGRPPVRRWEEHGGESNEGVGAPSTTTPTSPGLGPGPGAGHIHAHHHRRDFQWSRELLDGHYAGEVSILDGVNYRATITATHDSTFLTVDRADYNLVVTEGFDGELKKKVEYLSSLQWFRECVHKNDYRSLAFALVPKRFPAKSALCLEGQPAQQVYFLERGTCQVTRKVVDELPDTSQGKRSVTAIMREDAMAQHRLRSRDLAVATIAAGEMCGEESMMTDRDRGYGPSTHDRFTDYVYTVRATTEVVALTIDAASLRRMLNGRDRHRFLAHCRMILDWRDRKVEASLSSLAALKDRSRAVINRAKRAQRTINVDRARVRLPPANISDISDLASLVEPGVSEGGSDHPDVTALVQRLPPASVGEELEELALQTTYGPLLLGATGGASSTFFGGGDMTGRSRGGRSPVRHDGASPERSLSRTSLSCSPSRSTSRTQVDRTPLFVIPSEWTSEAEDALTRYATRTFSTDVVTRSMVGREAVAAHLAASRAAAAGTSAEMAAARAARTAARQQAVARAQMQAAAGEEERLWAGVDYVSAGDRGGASDIEREFGAEDGDEVLSADVPMFNERLRTVQGDGHPGLTKRRQARAAGLSLPRRSLTAPHAPNPRLATVEVLDEKPLAMKLGTMAPPLGSPHAPRPLTPVTTLATMLETLRSVREQVQEARLIGNGLPHLLADLRRARQPLLYVSLSHRPVSRAKFGPASFGDTGGPYGNGVGGGYEGQSPVANRPGTKSRTLRKDHSSNGGPSMTRTPTGVRIMGVEVVVPTVEGASQDQELPHHDTVEPVAVEVGHLDPELSFAPISDKDVDEAMEKNMIKNNYGGDETTRVVTITPAVLIDGRLTTASGNGSGGGWDVPEVVTGLAATPPSATSTTPTPIPVSTTPPPARTTSVLTKTTSINDQASFHSSRTTSKAPSRATSRVSPNPPTSRHVMYVTSSHGDGDEYDDDDQELDASSPAKAQALALALGVNNDDADGKDEIGLSDRDGSSKDEGFGFTIDKPIPFDKYILGRPIPLDSESDDDEFADDTDLHAGMSRPDTGGDESVTQVKATLSWRKHAKVQTRGGGAIYRREYESIQAIDMSGRAADLGKGPLSPYVASKSGRLSTVVQGSDTRWWERDQGMIRANRIALSEKRRLARQATQVNSAPSGEVRTNHLPASSSGRERRRFPNRDLSQDFLSTRKGLLSSSRGPESITGITGRAASSKKSGTAPHPPHPEGDSSTAPTTTAATTTAAMPWLEGGDTSAGELVGDVNDLYGRWGYPSRPQTRRDPRLIGLPRLAKGLPGMQAKAVAQVTIGGSQNEALQHAGLALRSPMNMEDGGKIGRYTAKQLGVTGFSQALRVAGMDRDLSALPPSGAGQDGGELGDGAQQGGVEKSGAVLSLSSKVGGKKNPYPFVRPILKYPPEGGVDPIRVHDAVALAAWNPSDEVMTRTVVQKITQRGKQKRWGVVTG
jgi:CRP-like cAMP-binding protein